jgi:hypothetical protein
MATLKSKQTSIATVRKHLRTVASLPTSLTFHYPLPLKQENSSHVILSEAFPEEPLYYLKDFPV